MSGRNVKPPMNPYLHGTGVSPAGRGNPDPGMITAASILNLLVTLWTTLPTCKPRAFLLQFARESQRISQTVSLSSEQSRQQQPAASADNASRSIGDGP